MISPLFLFLFSVLEINVDFSLNNACPVKSQESFIQNSLQAIEAMKQSKEFQSFLTQSDQQRDVALEDKNFQEIIASLQAQTPLQRAPFKHQLETANKPGELYVFVSFSMGEKALLNLAQEAKTYGATLILRGFKGDSYAKTVHALQRVIQKTGQGFLIDPELFTLFGVTAVPTYVMAKPFNLFAQERSQTMPLDRVEGKLSGVSPEGPLHDRLQGHVSIRYALETFAKVGDLQVEARSILDNTSQEKEVHQ